ncbi:hypothetical protein [Nocardia sp. NPDC051570]|uniref:hypothetical protein n=1 Tax=Nocardia sp. NPDC051570 TaxID=3364324 RepID=UPI0037A3D0BA
MHRFDTANGPTLDNAVAAYVHRIANPNTARSYRVVLRGLVDRLGPQLPVAALDTEPIIDDISEWFVQRWGYAAPSTLNVRRYALRSASAWWRQRGWITGDPARRILRRADELDPADPTGHRRQPSSPPLRP